MRLFRFLILISIFVSLQFVASYFLSQKHEMKFIDMMFYNGVFTTAISLYFTSDGGIITNYSEAETATSYQGLKSKHTF